MTVIHKPHEKRIKNLVVNVDEVEQKIPAEKYMMNYTKIEILVKIVKATVSDEHANLQVGIFLVEELITNVIAT